MEPLTTYLGSRLLQKPPQDFTTIAAQILLRHTNVAMIFAYGSGLRGETSKDTLLDLYVLTDDASGVSTNSLSAGFCQIIPPNVYYIDHNNIRAKYAALPFAIFERWLRPSTHNPYFWARFAQPTQIVWARREADQKRFVTCIAQAAQTSYAIAKSLDHNPIEAWSQFFAKTYTTEFRPEQLNRARELVLSHQSYFTELSKLLKSQEPRSLNWPLIRLQGKIWSGLRLIKATFTFQGGADYAAWKISKHSGEKIIIKEWQRRHPLLAGLLMLPKLLSKGLLK